jgi:hypothetical protein
MKPVCKTPLGAVLLLAACCLCCATAGAQEAAPAPPAEPPSPWVLLPTFSNNPKLGTAVGGMAAYLQKFDAQSQLSVFGTSFQYTSTDSATLGLFGRASWGQDHHRVTALAIGGLVRNDYDDFLGTGTPLKSEDHIRSIVGRYLYRVKDDWFLGMQGISTNYQIVGQTALDDDVLGLLGLSGFTARGVGVVAYHDSRDVQDAPKKGWLLNLNNIAYRQSESDTRFDVYRLDYRHFWSHGDGHVLAIRQSNQWTQDAPPGALAPVLLRGYTMGEYLGKSMSSFEVEERHKLADRWTATVFAGMACLYGASRGGCGSSDNRFPTVGAGVQYVLKPAQGIVANLEAAVGKDGNKALLFKMGYSW